MRSLLISSALAITISCSAYAKSAPTAHPPKAAPCVTVSDLDEVLAAKGMKEKFVVLPPDLYNTFVADTHPPKETTSMVAVVTATGMIVAPLDAKGCVLGTAAFTMEELDKLGKPPAAAPGETHDGADHV